MCRLITSLVTWRRLPVSGGFEALDLQINKLRNLRDSYQLQNENIYLVKIHGDD